MYIFILFFVSYFVSSINPSIILCGLIKKQDIRTLGSGNAGTTNAIRVLGKTMGIIVFVLDVLKVVLSYYIVYRLYNNVEIFQNYNLFEIKGIFLIGCIIGHCYPIYYKFKGGKGVVVATTAMFIIDYRIALICFIFGILIITITRTVSLGSLLGITTCLILVIIFNSQYVDYVFVSLIIIIFKHKSNIKRLLKREENKLKL